MDNTMDNTREKLIELLCEAMLIFDKKKNEPNINPFAVFADYLIANRVTFQEHDCHWATEIAYKNGYEAGMKDAKEQIVPCKECASSDTVSCPVGRVWCGLIYRHMKEDDFCSYGKRRAGK